MSTVSDLQEVLETLLHDETINADDQIYISCLETLVVTNYAGTVIDINDNCITYKNPSSYTIEEN